MPSSSNSTSSHFSSDYSRQWARPLLALAAPYSYIHAYMHLYKRYTCIIYKCTRVLSRYSYIQLYLSNTVTKLHLPTRTHNTYTCTFILVLVSTKVGFDGVLDDLQESLLTIRKQNIIVCLYIHLQLTCIYA